MSIKMLFDNVAILKDQESTMSAGGIALPGGNGKERNTGTIMAVGPGKFSEHAGRVIPTQVQDGQRVVFSKYAGNTVNHDGENLCVLHECELLAILPALENVSS